MKTTELRKFLHAAAASLPIPTSITTEGLALADKIADTFVDGLESIDKDFELPQYVLVEIARGFAALTAAIGWQDSGVREAVKAKVQNLTREAVLNQYQPETGARAN